MGISHNKDHIKPDNPCRKGWTSLAWVNYEGRFYWLHGDEHWKFADYELEYLPLEDYIDGDSKRTLILTENWIKVSNYRDMAMAEYDEERHFDFASQDPDSGWDYYEQQLARLAEFIVDCVVYNNDDPNEPIINIVYMSWLGPKSDERVTMTPHEVVEKFGGPKYGKKLLDKMYEGLMNRMTKRNPFPTRAQLGKTYKEILKRLKGIFPSDFVSGNTYPSGELMVRMREEDLNGDLRLVEYIALPRENSYIVTKSVRRRKQNKELDRWEIPIKSDLSAKKQGQLILQYVWGLEYGVDYAAPRQSNPGSSLGSIALAGLAGYFLGKK